jgi:NitT/TauT family transport system permease protein
VSTPPWRIPKPRAISGSLKRLLIWILILAIWEGAYRVFHWHDWVFPAPSHIVDSLLGLLNINTGFGLAIGHGWPHLDSQPFFGDGSVLRSPLIVANLTSGLRLLVGFVISIVLGIALGGLMWRFKPIDEFLGPFALGLQTLPSVCWVPLAIIFFHYSESGIQFVLVMGSAFAIAISVRDGMRAIPPLYQRAGLMLGASGWKLYPYVLLPAALPAVASGLRQGFSFAWRSLMGGELVFGAALTPKGLGVLLDDGRNVGGPAQVIGIMIVMVLIGMFADRLLFAPLERRVHKRFGLVASS